MNRKTVIANIGLMTGAKYGEVGETYPVEVEGALNAVDYYLNNLFHREGLIHAHKVEHSNSEPTLIVSVEVSGNIKEIFEDIAKRLKQEAIAYYVVEEQKGYLVGEYAEEWGGEFKAEYFLI